MRKAGYPLAEQGKARTSSIVPPIPLKRTCSSKPVAPAHGAGADQGRERQAGRQPRCARRSGGQRDYLNKLSPWIEGQYWNDDLLKEYRTTLQETGLFSAIDDPPALSRTGEGGGWTDESLAEAGFSELP